MKVDIKMSNYKFPINIKKLNLDTEQYEDYYKTHANINKTSGKEYFNASSNISDSTLNFKVRYCELIKDIIYNTEIFIIEYDGRVFDIKTVDRYAESKTESTIVGEFNGKTYTN